MAKGNVAAEPSMEEILASIRRIIADEEPGQVAATKNDYIAEALPDEPDEAAAGKTVSTDDILDLGAAEEEATVGEIPAQPVAPVDMDDLSFDQTEQETPAPEPPRAKQNEWSEPLNKPAPRPQIPVQQSYAPPPTPSGLISEHTGTAVSAAFNSLASAIFSNEPRTIEDLTKEMLRPLLKQWLDDNLPSLVERIVRDEIERVARGRK
jgi:cell pole-organizing protein PopZ